MNFKIQFGKGQDYVVMCVKTKIELGAESHGIMHI